MKSGYYPGSGLYYLRNTNRDLGVDSIKRCHLSSIGNPIVEIRRSYDRLISTMGFPILVRWHHFIESGPRGIYPCIAVGPDKFLKGPRDREGPAELISVYKPGLNGAYCLIIFHKANVLLLLNISIDQAGQLGYVWCRKTENTWMLKSRSKVLYDRN